jgi:hypothetical protein
MALRDFVGANERGLSVFRLTLLVLLLATPALGQADVIHACVAKSNGKVRIVAVAGMCNSRTETPLDWNSTGPGGAAFTFVGFTTGTIGNVGGFNAGVLEWTRTCRAEFAGSRTCTSDEVLTAVDPPTIANPDDFAWVVPRLIAPNVDASGIGFNFSCAGFTGATSAGALGIVVDGHGRFSLAQCAEAHRVACCVPPVP